MYRPPESVIGTMILLWIIAGAFGSPTSTLLSPEEATEDMTSRIAAEEGWTLLDTIDLIREQAEFNEIVQSVAENCPNQFSAAENTAEPGGTASIYFKGDEFPLCAHAFLQDVNVSVSVITGALENELEIDEHADEVGDYLANNGYADFVVGSRVDGTIRHDRFW